LYARRLFASPPLSVVSTCDGGGAGYRRCVVVGVVFVMAVSLRRGGSGGASWLVVEVVGGMSWQRSTAMSQFDDVVTGVMACTIDFL